MSREVAEPYYLYGRALLEVAREKSAVFGEGIPGEWRGDEGGRRHAREVLRQVKAKNMSRSREKSRGSR